MRGERVRARRDVGGAAADLRRAGVGEGVVAEVEKACGEEEGRR